MNAKHFIRLSLCGLLALGCHRSNTSSPQPTPAPGGLPLEMRGTDLSTYGIPGLVDLPERCKVTRLDEANIAIDREDDAFDLRILPLAVHVTTLADSRKSLKDEPWQFIADETDGYAVWRRDELGQHCIDVYREVTLDSRKFVARAIIRDERGSKELAESVWRTAKSVRVK